MTSRIIDFDAFRAEQKHEPVILRIGGIDYDLPPSLPAAVAIDVLVLQQTLEDDEAEVPFETLQKVGEAIFGAEVWEACLRKHQLSIDEIPDLIGQVISIYAPEPTADPSKAST